MHISIPVFNIIMGHITKIHSKAIKDIQRYLHKENLKYPLGKLQFFG